MTALTTYGWTPERADHFARKYGEGCIPGRVVVCQSTYSVATSDGIVSCSLAGRLKHAAEGADDLPAIGDWVCLESGTDRSSGRIVDVLPRKSQFTRKVAGVRTQAQVLASNIDTVFLVSGLDGEFNPARIERYLVLVREGGADPVIVLNKTDLCSDIETAFQLAAEAAPGVRLLGMSAKTREGFLELSACLQEGRTGVLLGSSGVGKSSIVNLFFDVERMKVTDVRDADSKGRHTTKHRELILLPSGGMLIDTPGTRELGLWGEGTGIQDAFDDIEEIGSRCKFRDCRHDTEPGCAVLAALEDGTLDRSRYESYRKLHRELIHLKAKHDIFARIQTKRAAKKLSAAQKRWPKNDE